MAVANLQVGASSDDAEEHSGSVTLGLVYIRCYTAGTYTNGWRFLAIAVPQGSTINTATFSYKFTTTSNDDLYADVHGEDQDNPGTFTTGASNISGRVQTTASATISTASGGVDWQTVDVASIVQEIVNRGGWSSGNAMVIIIDVTNSSSTGRVVAYDGDAANCGKLDIDYTAPSGGVVILRRRMEKT